MILSEHSLSWARSALGDRDWLVRQSAVTALGDNAADTVPLLMAALKDDVVGVRRSAARALGRRSERAALAALRDALRDGDASVRTEALRSVVHIAQALRDRGRRDADAGLVQTLKEVRATGSAPEKMLATFALVQLGESSLTQELLAFQSSGDAELRKLFVQQLTSEWIPGTAALVRALGDSVPAVRLAAARRLAEGGDRRALPVLREATKGDGSDALAAYGLMRRLGESIAAPAELESLLTQPNTELRLEAIGAQRRDRQTKK